MTIKELLEEYDKYRKLKLNFDLTRGKPSLEQLNLSNGILVSLQPSDSFVDEDGFDVRNYGELTGIYECKKLMSALLEVPDKNIIVFGNSSLNIMYNLISKSITHGVCGEKPWMKLSSIKWLCPVPGYDRHFSITEYFGIEMINIPMDSNGPDMDLVERLIKDESVKGIWCVPKYSNPMGITYSDEVVKRFARLKPAARDFRIYWDNAYSLHCFNGEDKLLNVFEEATKCNNEDIVYIFSSTAKISFPGGGVAALGCSDNNVCDISNQMKYQTICYDKINQLRHVIYFKDAKGIKEHMKKHASLLKPKFDIVLKALNDNLRGYATWTEPNGGYFITVKVDSFAKEVVARCNGCGVKLTEAGSTHPYHIDPHNSFIRIAPSYLDNDELRIAMEVFCLSVKIEYYIRNK